jgi:DNA polymerase-3 subunit gamma/tau
LLYVLPSQADEVADFGRRLGLQKILAMTQIIDQAAARLRLSMHGRTLLEIALVRICHLDDLDDLATLVAELRDGADATASAAHAATAAKKNSEPAGHLLGQIPPLPELARTKPSAAAAPAAADSVGAMATVAPAPGGSATEMEGSAPPLNSVLSQFQQALKTGDSSPPRPQRPSRREQMAEIAERPIVRRAMELFDVPPGQFRYVPPEGEVG